MRTWTWAAVAVAACAAPAAAQPKGKASLDNNLKMIGLALFNHESANGAFPPPAVVGKDGKPLLSWRVAVLPYVETGGDTLYQQFKLDEPWDSPANKKVLADNPLPEIYSLPLGPKPAEKDVKKTHFQAFAGAGAAFEPGKKLRIAEFTDGTSNTVFLSLAKTPVEWTKPDDIAFDPKADVRKLLLKVTRAGKPNDEAGYRVLMCDGSVRGVDADVTEADWKKLVTRAGGELFPLK